MAINSYFFNAVLSDGVYDRIYNAEDVTSYLDMIVGNGVFPNPSTNLQVRAGTGMNVIVGAGQGWINGHKMINTADLTVAISSANAVHPRIDAVIFYVDTSTRTMGISVKTGTAAASPVAPTLTRSSSRWELCLAQVRVNSQVSSITGAMITDTRGNSDLCGYVQGLIQQMDSTTMFQQWQDAFDTWFASVQSDLHASYSFKKLEYVYVTSLPNESSFTITDYIPSYSYVYDILEVYVNGIHLSAQDYYIYNGAAVLYTPIEKAGAVVDLVVYKSYDPND